MRKADANRTDLDQQHLQLQRYTTFEQFPSARAVVPFVFSFYSKVVVVSPCFWLLFLPCTCRLFTPADTRTQPQMDSFASIQSSKPPIPSQAARLVCFLRAADWTDPPRRTGDHHHSVALRTASGSDRFCFASVWCAVALALGISRSVPCELGFRLSRAHGGIIHGKFEWGIICKLCFQRCPASGSGCAFPPSQ